MDQTTEASKQRQWVVELAKDGNPNTHTSTQDLPRNILSMVWTETTAEILIQSQESGVIRQIRKRDGNYADHWLGLGLTHQRNLQEDLKEQTTEEYSQEQMEVGSAKDGIASSHTSTREHQRIQNTEGIN